MTLTTIPETSAVPEADSKDHVLILLKTTPLSVNQIIEHYPQTDQSAKKRKHAITAALNSFLESGEIFCHKSKGNYLRYWIHDEKERARQIIRQQLVDKPKAENPLLNEVARVLGTGASKTWLSRVLKEMEGNDELHVYPKLGPVRAKRFALEPVDPKIYLTKTFLAPIQSLCKTLAKVDVPTNVILAAITVAIQGSLIPTETNGQMPSDHDQIPSEDIADLLLKVMEDIDPSASQGGMISIPELRQESASVISNKECFDAVVLQLATQSAVDIHKHVTPGSLSDDERNTLVTDGQGNYYIGIAKRM